MSSKSLGWELGRPWGGGWTTPPGTREHRDVGQEEEVTPRHRGFAATAVRPDRMRARPP